MVPFLLQVAGRLETAAAGAPAGGGGGDSGGGESIYPSVEDIL